MRPLFTSSITDWISSTMHRFVQSITSAWLWRMNAFTVESSTCGVFVLHRGTGQAGVVVEPAKEVGSVGDPLLALSSILKGGTCRISSIRAFLLRATGSLLLPPRIHAEDHVESDLRNCKHSLLE